MILNTKLRLQKLWRDERNYCLWHTGQLTWRKDTWNVLFTRTTTTLTLLIRRNIYDSYFTDQLKMTQRKGTQHLSRQWLMPYIKGTSEIISRMPQPYKIRVAHKPTTILRHLLTNVKDRDEPNNRQGAVSLEDQMLRLPGLVRLAETLTRDWLNTKVPRDIVMPTITLLYIINWQTTTLIGTLLSA